MLTVVNKKRGRSLKCSIYSLIFLFGVFTFCDCVSKNIFTSLTSPSDRTNGLVYKYLLYMYIQKYEFMHSGKTQMFQSVFVILISCNG